MEVTDKRAVTGSKVDPETPVIFGNVEGYVPAFDRILIKRLPPPPETIGGIIRPEIMRDQAERGIVIAVGETKYPAPPVGVIATFSKFAEEKHFDDEGEDRYVLPWNVDIRGWHKNA